MNRTTLEVMGTVFSITADVAPQVVDEVFSWWRHVEHEFSTFLPESQISRIGRGELDPDDADPEVRHVLAVCAELEDATAGRFSIRPGRPGGPSLDPAGYVKGWSVDEAALILLGAGVTDFALYAGGDVLCGGSPTDADAWEVGIRLPNQPDTVGAVLTVNNAAVASSGTYRRGDHIWGSPDRRVLGASVVGPHLGMADALATAVFAGQDESFEWISAYPDYSLVVFTADGQVLWSESLRGSIVVGAETSAPPGDK
jgi:FAD:protein FMN transferase